MRTSAIVAALLLAVSSAAAQPTAPPTPARADPPLAKALASGLERLCAGFLSNPAASDDALKSLAARAGYAPGSADPYRPVGEPIANASPARSFSRRDRRGRGGRERRRPSDHHANRLPGSGQRRPGRLSAFLASMPALGGELVTAAEITPDTTYSHEVYRGGVTGLPRGYTTFVSRWVGPAAPKSGLWTIINVLPNAASSG